MRDLLYSSCHFLLEYDGVLNTARMSPADKTNLRHLGLVVVPLAVALEHLGELVLPVVRDDLHVAVPRVPPAPPAAAAAMPPAAPVPLVAGTVDRDHLSPPESDSLKDYYFKIKLEYGIECK